MALSRLVAGLVGEGLVLLAIEPDRKQPPPVDLRLLWWHYLALLGFVLVALVVLYLVMRWWKDAGSGSPSASDQLSEFRTLYEQGQISREEFDRLRSLLGERMVREVERQPPAPPGPEPRPSPGGPSPPAESPAPESRNGSSPDVV
jgi:hypothetical protein